MRWLQTLSDSLRRVRDAVPGLAVGYRAMRNYIGHQSANQAGSVAFSAVLSMGPMLLFLAAAAAYVGKPGAAADLATRLLEYAPALVAKALKPVVDDVLVRPNRALLGLGALAALWPASSGVQSVRTALNRAYSVTGTLSFWRARLKVMFFTVMLTAVTLAAFSSVVVLPYAWALLHRSAAGGADLSWMLDALRYALAYVVLVVMYAAMYGYLPDRHQRLRTVVPGALIGAVLWLLAAAFLSYSLRGAGKLALVYGSFAGLVATLIFLYVSAATLIYGAEINAVLGRPAAQSAVP